MKSYNGLYLMGNYPDPDTFVSAALKGLEFFDFLEVGLPYSDPIADGEVIADAAFAVIERGETFASICRSVAHIKKQMPEKKIFFMNYANTAHARGFSTFCQAAADNGVSGLIVPDIPFVESDSIRNAASSCNMEYVDFLTVESADHEIDAMAASGPGFLYAVSMRGITGQTASFAEGIEDRIQYAKKAGSRPVVMGFGIRDSKTARIALESADGFIMGTVPIKKLNDGVAEFTRFIDTMKEEMYTALSTG